MILKSSNKTILIIRIGLRTNKFNIQKSYTIIIFTRKRSFRNNLTTTYLLADATVTAIHLPSIYLQSILVDGFGLGVFNTNDIACRERNYLFYVTTVAAISFPCWASFDQYAITCREASFRNRWSSIKVIRLVIIGTVIFWAIIYFPLIFFYSHVDCFSDYHFY